MPLDWSDSEPINQRLIPHRIRVTNWLFERELAESRPVEPGKPGFLKTGSACRTDFGFSRKTFLCYCSVVATIIADYLDIAT